MTETTLDSGAPQSTRRNTYVVVGLVLVVLAVLALMTRPARVSAAAQDKADQLIAALTEAGVAEPPSQDAIVQVFGDDGGAVCADPNSALKRGLFLTELSNGAGGPGMRPVITDPRVIAGEALVIGVYCPDELAEFEEFVRTMKFDDVVNG